MMHISGRLDENENKFYKKVENLGKLHKRHNKEFKLPENIRKSKDPVKTLNNVIIKDSIFSFSFVRHPYKR